jgi:tetratricopeptide (TPR) repeat protein
MKKILLMALVLFLAAPAVAQSWGEEWGVNPEDREQNVTYFNIYNPAVKRGDWPLAAQHLHLLMQNAPAAHTAIYTLAVEMYKKRADEATTPAEKTAMADSLILMYDKYLEIFPTHDRAPQVVMNRALHTRQYFGNDRERVMAAFRGGAELAGDRMPALYVAYFNELTSEYKNNIASAEDYLSEYGRLSGRLADMGAAEQQDQLGQLFASSGAADCATLEKVYAKIIDDDPENVQKLDGAIAMLNMANCHGEFYTSVAEKLYKVAPTARIARVIAASYKERGDASTASKYIEEAIALAATPEEKTEVLLGVASDEVLAHNYRNAYNYAHDIAQINPQNATAHYLMALATAGGAQGCSDAMAQRAVYWLAYDRMQEARRLAAADPSTKPEMLQEMEANLARFAAAFPEAQEIFLQTLDEGAGYTVNCGWVSGRTTVRRRP